MRFLINFARIHLKNNRPNRHGLFASLFIVCLAVPIGVAATNQLSQTVGAPPFIPVTIEPLLTEKNHAQAAIEASGSNALYLPVMATPNTCTLSAEEEAIANFAINHPSQGRSIMTCDPTLSQVARERAEDMAMRSYFDHTNPDGFGPNYLVKQAGYDLPNWYSNELDANNIESIAAGYSSASSAWAGWMDSSGHRAHLLAESSFWQSQTNYGVGYYYDPSSPYRYYWVFISAPPQE